jgi:hypothetical protein
MEHRWSLSRRGSCACVSQRHRKRLSRVSRCGIFWKLVIRFWRLLKRGSRFSIDWMQLNLSDVMLVIHCRCEIFQNVWMRRNRIWN